MNTLHYIGGRWQPAQDDRCFEVRNPADDSLIADVSEGAAADARLAVDAAALALPAWKARPARERCIVLKKWHALIERDVEPLAQLISREQGKPLAEEAGVPPGVLNIVAASRERTPQVVGEWVADPRVRKISFTGSTPVGKLLARESAATLKKLSLELGGNAPFIVFEDADVDAAVEGLMASKFRNGGQTCVSPNRVYVHAAVHDRFVDKLAARVGALRVGPADWPEAEIGPMINARAVDKIERHVNDAVAKGATVVVGGQRVRNERARGPNYYAPTVLTNATRDMELSCEETFGPVVPVFRFVDEAEVIAQANDTPYGLAGYFYSQDVKRIWRVASALETGMVGINEGAIAAQAAPFGGVKESGYGREGSRWGLDEYMHTKYLCQGGLQ